MQIDIDSIEYGNPSRQDYQLLTVDTYLDYLIPQIEKLLPPPKNSSAGTKHELNELIDYSIQDQQSPRRHIFDKQLVPYIRELFVNNGAEKKQVEMLTQNIIDDVLPVITKLKYSFQRPRPYQLARIYRLQLFPSYSYFVSSPSYPSGHTALAAVICETLGNVYPSSYEIMKKFVSEVSESRLYMGVHYPSDNNTALLIAEKIVSNPAFKKKYEL